MWRRCHHHPAHQSQSPSPLISPDHMPPSNPPLGSGKERNWKKKMRKCDNEVVLVSPGKGSGAGDDGGGDGGDDNDENQIYEGLSSNFFCVKNGKIFTAPPGSVLTGTIQKMVIEVARRKEIEVIYSCPNVKEIDQWEGAFITSTSRELLPIDEYYFLGETETHNNTNTNTNTNQIKTKQIKNSNLVYLLKNLIQKEMEERATPVPLL
eukprot:TRINITY_DN631_c0_g1_i1.p1 TRINITY_DN631_c0_g1~~TRINITY_DN631_c0_g1_i1.p1  ORF type:complete len:208 (-),score=77.36 TRINITY_DN631_c0_g1_i1:726-1349(-)